MLARNKVDPLDLLAEACRLLSASFDLSSTLPNVADLCVRSIADYCAISASFGEGNGVTLVEAASEPGVHLRFTDAQSAQSVLSEFGYESVISCTLAGRNVRGVFTMGHRRAHAYSEETRKLVSILALQVANTLDQAELFERTHRVADKLQRALLPDSLPSVRGAAFNAAYRPASDEAEVGGDWYDAFPLPDGRIAISMGDVAGHGLSAATIMGEVRQAMRTTAVFEHSPSDVLEHINNVINLRSGIGMVTAIFGYYHPDTRELTYAVAGHPPPAIAIADGFSGFLPGGGLPLGVDANVQATDYTVTLPPRSGVVFYTDGMTEYSRDIFAGEEKLLEAAVRAFESDLENPALALQERVFDAKTNRDDAAALTLLCKDGLVGESIQFSAIPLAAPIVRALISRFCAQHGLDGMQAFAITTAVGEAVANAVEHAYRSENGSFSLHASMDGDDISIEVKDFGKWRPFSPRDERGRGMILMNELMDRVRVTSSQTGTTVTLMAKRQPPEAPALH